MTGPFDFFTTSSSGESLTGCGPAGADPAFSAVARALMGLAPERTVTAPIIALRTRKVRRSTLNDGADLITSGSRSHPDRHPMNGTTWCTSIAFYMRGGVPHRERNIPPCARA